MILPFYNQDLSVDTKQKQTWNFALLNLQNFFDRRKKNLTLLFFSSNSIEGSSELKNHRKSNKTAKNDRKYLFFVLDSLRRLRDFINLFFRWSSENQNKNVTIDIRICHDSVKNFLIENWTGKLKIWARNLGEQSYNHAFTIISKDS